MSGTVLDAQAAEETQRAVPVVGATVRVGDAEGVTDRTGRFTIAVAPVGVFPFEIIGSTAQPAASGRPYTDYSNAIDIPDGSGLFSLGIFYATQRTAFATQIDPATTTVVGNPEVDALVLGSSTRLEVAAGSATSIATGEPFAGSMTVTRVPNCCTPSAMPQFVVDEAPLIVTVQPLGVEFDPPAPLDLPNTNGYAAGATLNLWSLNPDTGVFEVKGLGRVTADGSTIETVSGGLVQTDWHFFVPPNQEEPRFVCCRTTQVAANQPVNVSIRDYFTDGQGDRLTFSRLVGPEDDWEAEIDRLSGDVTGPALAVGEQASVTVIVSDGENSITQVLSFEGTDRPIYIGPQQLAPPARGIWVVDFSSLFINPGSGSLTWSLSNGIESQPVPSAGIDANGLFSVDTAQIFFWDFEVRATNSAGSTSEYFFIDRGDSLIPQ